MISKLTIRWPVLPAPDHPQDYFFGGWCTDGALQVETDQPRASTPPRLLLGSRYFLASSTSPFSAESNGLVWQAPAGSRGAEAVAFRGYVLSPALSALSEPDRLFDYWGRDGRRTHNGVFAAAVVGEGGQSLTLVTDAFGIAPLYWRRAAGMILFATNPRFLTMPGDVPNMKAWRFLLHTGYVGCDWTLTEGVERLPGGAVFRADATGSSVTRWFDMGALSDAPQDITPAVVEEVHRRFDVAVQRCVALAPVKTMLPLSSGHDSRRILASLVKHGADFEAKTVRVFQKGARDLDAPGAAALAQQFGFPHQILDLPAPPQFAVADRLRRHLTDAETKRHTWAMTLWQSMTDGPRLVFDGLAGDVFGETGFEVREFFTDDEEAKAVGIANKVVGGGFESILRREAWPAVDTLIDDVADFVRALPEGVNRAEFAFLLLRTRRQVALWAQHLMGAGHVLVCPYLELDYVTFLLSLSPLQKLKASLQNKALQMCAPEFYPFAGSRQIPATGVPVHADLSARNAAACLRMLEAEMKHAAAAPRVASLVTTWARAVALAAGWNASIADSNTARWLAPLLALVLRETAQPCLVLRPANRSGAV